MFLRDWNITKGPLAVFLARVTSTGLENTMPKMNVIFSALTEWVLISPDPQVYLQDCKVPIVFCLSVTEPV